MSDSFAIFDGRILLRVGGVVLIGLGLGLILSVLALAAAALSAAALSDFNLSAAALSDLALSALALSDFNLNHCRHRCCRPRLSAAMVRHLIGQSVELPLDDSTMLCLPSKPCCLLPQLPLIPFHICLSRLSQILARFVASIKSKPFHKTKYSLRLEAPRSRRIRSTSYSMVPSTNSPSGSTLHQYFIPRFKRHFSSLFVGLDTHPLLCGCILLLCLLQLFKSSNTRIVTSDCPSVYGPSLPPPICGPGADPRPLLSDGPPPLPSPEPSSSPPPPPPPPPPARTFPCPLIALPRPTPGIMTGGPPLLSQPLPPLTNRLLPHDAISENFPPFLAFFLFLSVSATCSANIR
ncbi:hypothetical protein BSKO_02678 [Bryopsis sp. KO-2023]|nr:hypothetical protein BSKO_02678 [Bryopsis sp. KO-2023]